MTHTVQGTGATRMVEREELRRALREAARRYMDTDAVVHETRALAEALRE